MNEVYVTFGERPICWFGIFQKHPRIWALVWFHEPALAMTSWTKCNMAENMEKYVARYCVFLEGCGCMSKKIRKVGLVLSFLELYTVFWSLSSYNYMNRPKNICPFWSIVPTSSAPHSPKILVTERSDIAFSWMSCSWKVLHVCVCLWNKLLHSF